MTDREVLSECPPSAKLVYKVLEHDGELTQQELAEATMLSPRTVRHALSDLDEEGLIDQRVYLADARQKIYSLQDAEAEADVDAAAV
ncbi:helix-turn-helix transcriptional regulator [Natronoarchaeum mannanilyticum]|uniref:Helix-turn-helix domain-containing protein n=1 Tax=Natronoarchaeum mannanilyticum TaxID=926360 RepID=A0AAV3T544_9EURY